MTLTARVQFKDPDLCSEILDMFPESDERHNNRYMEFGEYATLELTIHVQAGIPCISAARFVPVADW